MHDMSSVIQRTALLDDSTTYSTTVGDIVMQKYPHSVYSSPSGINKIFTNLRHTTTKTTSSIKATLEPAPIAIYVVCSIPVRIINYFEKKI